MSMGFTIIAPEEAAEEIASKYSNADVVGRVEEGEGVLLEPGNILYDHY
jgi:phosphoribosylformylglycinamidine cyclo-ligase